VISAVLALHTILIDTKEEGVVFCNILRCNLNSRHIPSCKVEVLSYFFLAISKAKRIDSKDVGDESVLTESTSKTDLHAREHFQYWFTKTPWERFLTPLEKLSEKFSLCALGCFAAQLYTSAAPFQKCWRWPWQWMHWLNNHFLLAVYWDVQLM